MFAGLFGQGLLIFFCVVASSSSIVVWCKGCKVCKGCLCEGCVQNGGIGAREGVESRRRWSSYIGDKCDCNFFFSRSRGGGGAPRHCIRASLAKLSYFHEKHIHILRHDSTLS